MPFDKVEEIIEKYSNECINKKTNTKINNEKCDKMLLYLQTKLLPKNNNKKIYKI
tara:strand:+ start:8962 stop:9126 length:165 start_codon:yes stop_codon:yes gene_type:complete